LISVFAKAFAFRLRSTSYYGQVAEATENRPPDGLVDAKSLKGNAGRDKYVIDTYTSNRAHNV
jgi:hypothetical protein